MPLVVICQLLLNILENFSMIIGLVGFIGSGKGTVGDILEQKGFIKDSFAKPLKDACSVMF